MEQVAELDTQYRARIVAEVFCSQLYKIPDLKTAAKPKPPRLSSVIVAVADARGAKAATEGLRIGAAVGSGVALTRDLANLPPNVCTPSYLGTRAQALAKDFPSIKTKVLDASGIRALKMGAFLAVTQGSEQPPRLIVCEYNGAKKNVAPVCLVGKGITFDSGGISLKDPPAMDEMKFDMSGAAAVLGTMRCIAELKLPINLVVIVPTCENMPSGGAVKPADIVTTMSGQTVEILNTDAEGRLILCDAITYSRRFKPAAVIDVATLTGACIVALGNHFSGLMSNDEALADELESAARSRRRPGVENAGRRGIRRAIEKQFRRYRQCRRTRGRRLHRGIFSRKVRQGFALGPSGCRRHRVARRRPERQHRASGALARRFSHPSRTGDMTERVDFYVLKSAAAHAASGICLPPDGKSVFAGSARRHRQ